MLWIARSSLSSPIVAPNTFALQNLFRHSINACASRDSLRFLTFETDAPSGIMVPMAKVSLHNALDSTLHDAIVSVQLIKSAQLLSLTGYALAIPIAVLTTARSHSAGGKIASVVFIPISKMSVQLSDATDQRLVTS